ncbi:hypothetical protein ILYODFUR_016197, partial [Ilyodon furcidens]
LHSSNLLILIRASLKRSESPYNEPCTQPRSKHLRHIPRQRPQLPGVRPPTVSNPLREATNRLEELERWQDWSSTDGPAVLYTDFYNSWQLCLDCISTKRKETLENLLRIKSAPKCRGKSFTSFCSLH